jgi:GT2 family glycosyltransferase
MRAQIDVVIPAFNAKAYLTETLQSVAQQGEVLAQIILVNDGSTDHTAACVHQFAAAHPQMNIVLVEQANLGLSAARNTGIRKSTAPYIAFLDADDLWQAHKLDTQLQLFLSSIDPKLGVVYTGYSLISESSAPLSANTRLVAPKVRGDVYQALLRGNFISGSGSSVLIKREVLDAVGGFDEKLHASEDWDMWLRIARQFHFDFVDKPLVAIRVHAKNMQKDRLRMLSAELMLLNKLTQMQTGNDFLLWKIRTILVEQKITATQIPGFDECNPRLQKQLTGPAMQLSKILLTPLQYLAKAYLAYQKQVR